MSKKVVTFVTLAKLLLIVFAVIASAYSIRQSPKTVAVAATEPVAAISSSL
ncbi:MAG: hypothetical protein K6G80_01530 [Treponema sp.]|nr:hypothetical protein [Treponema sp.]